MHLPQDTAHGEAGGADYDFLEGQCDLSLAPKTVRTPRQMPLMQSGIPREEEAIKFRSQNNRTAEATTEAAIYDRF